MSFGNTPLHTAAVLGDFATVSALLSSGSRPDDTNTFGKLPEDVTSDARLCALLRGALCAWLVRALHDVTRLHDNLQKRELHSLVESAKSLPYGRRGHSRCGHCHLSTVAATVLRLGRVVCFSVSFVCLLVFFLVAGSTGARVFV